MAKSLKHRNGRKASLCAAHWNVCSIDAKCCRDANFVAVCWRACVALQQSADRHSTYTVKPTHRFLNRRRISYYTLGFPNIRAFVILRALCPGVCARRKKSAWLTNNKVSFVTVLWHIEFIMLSMCAFGSAIVLFFSFYSALILN